EQLPQGGLLFGGDLASVSGPPLAEFFRLIAPFLAQIRLLESQRFDALGDSPGERERREQRRRERGAALGLQRVAARLGGGLVGEGAHRSEAVALIRRAAAEVQPVEVPRPERHALDEVDLRALARLTHGWPSSSSSITS